MIGEAAADDPGSIVLVLLGAVRSDWRDDSDSVLVTDIVSSAAWSPVMRFPIPVSVFRTDQ